MKSVIVNLILTTALWAVCPVGAQQWANERVHDRVAPTEEAPHISFAGKQSMKKQLFRSTSASVTADFSCQSTGSAVTVWKEDFDDGAEGWTLTDAEDIVWELKSTTGDKAFSAIDPDDTQSLFIEGPYQVFKRGIATATSPQLDVPANAMLKGYVGFSQNMDNYCRLHI